MVPNPFPRRLIFLRAFGYDAAGRLEKRVMVPKPHAVTWAQPLALGMASGPSYGGTLTGATYGDDNRFLGCNGYPAANWSHDLDGNLTTGRLPVGEPQIPLGDVVLRPGTFTWDVRNRLRSVTDTHNSTPSTYDYEYDPEGNRILVGGMPGTAVRERHFISPHGPGGLSRVLVRHDARQMPTYYVYGLGLLYETPGTGAQDVVTATNPAGATVYRAPQYYHGDQVGSTVALTSAPLALPMLNSGNVQVTARFEYDAYGRLIRQEYPLTWLRVSISSSWQPPQQSTFFYNGQVAQWLQTAGVWELWVWDAGAGGGLLAGVWRKAQPQPATLTGGVTLQMTVTAAPPVTPFLYVGEHGVQTDLTTGLLHMRARYYSPYLRRFLNEDPIGFGGGMNWFAYANGNPIMNSDPSGLDTLYLWTKNDNGRGEDPRFFEKVAQAYAGTAARGIALEGTYVEGEPTNQQHIAPFADLPKLASQVSNITNIIVVGHPKDYQPSKFDLSSVSTSNVAANATITLYGCTAGSGGDCSGQRFADHFQRTTYAPPGGVTFGFGGAMLDYARTPSKEVSNSFQTLLPVQMNSFTPRVQQSQQSGNPRK